MVEVVVGLGLRATRGGEGDREGSRDGKNIPLQKHLPTDFTG
jgi:hypothetical protein